MIREDIRKKRLGKARIVEIPEVAEVERKAVKPPKVNPRVTAEEALEALRRTPGGQEVIQKLEKLGKRLV